MTKLPSIVDILNYYKNCKLGKLTLPIGTLSYIPTNDVDDIIFKPLTINLEDIFNCLNISLFDDCPSIDGILVFGSSVAHKSYKIKKYKRKKYIFFGEIIEVKFKEKIKPNDIDVLILSDFVFQKKRAHKPTIVESYDSGDFLTEAGIHITVISKDKLQEEIDQNTIISNNIRKGVPIIGNFDWLTIDTPYEAIWNIKNNLVSCIIQKIG